MLKKIEAFEPDFLLNIGGSNFTADICGEYFNLISVTTGSDIPVQSEGFFVIPSKPKEEDSRLAQILGIQDRVINLKYSFLKKDVEKSVTRSELKLPEDAFILIIVGTRLDLEVNEAFISVMHGIVEECPTVHFVFVGGYETYSQSIEKDPVLIGKTTNLGYRQDIQPIYAVCNAYLNPHRKGGASSAAEAMCAGIPVITEKYGDVYYQLWMDYSYDTDQERCSYIAKCIEDKEFYKRQKEYSKKHIEEFFDSERMIKEIVEFMDKKRNQ